MYYNNKRLALSVFWVVLGAALLVLSIAEVLDSSVYAGMGGALIAVGVFQVLRNLRYRKDSDYREKIDTEAGDERNHFLRTKSWAWTGYIVVLVECIGSVIAMVMGQQLVQEVLMYSVCMIVGIYWVTYMILARKY